VAAVLARPVPHAAVGAPQSLIGRPLAALPLGPSLDQASADVQQAGEHLARDPALVSLLQEARDRLAELIPDVAPDAFEMGSRRSRRASCFDSSSSKSSIWAIPCQSAARAAAWRSSRSSRSHCGSRPRRWEMFLLIDEPEVSLQPHAQRAVVRHLRTLCADDSRHALFKPALPRRPEDDRAPEARRRGGHRGVAIDAHWRRGASARAPHEPQTAEAFFVRAVILSRGRATSTRLKRLPTGAAGTSRPMASASSRSAAPTPLVPISAYSDLAASTCP
jgi:hypothetical protein